MNKQSQPIYEFGPFRLDTAERQLRRDGLPVVLTPKVYDILLALLDHNGQLLEKEALMQRVWPDTIVEENNLTVNMSALRKALGEAAGQHPYIETVPRRGYRFIADVRTVADAEIEMIVEKHSTSSLTFESSTLHEAETKPRNWLAVGSLAIIIMTVLTCGYYFYVFQRPAERVVMATPGSVAARRSVAVLGFKNLSGRPEVAWLSTAFAEMLSTELAAGRSLRTIPGENIARMKIELSVPEADSLAPDTLSRIRKNLGTDLVILGSYSALGKEAGGQIRLDLRLQDAASGETIAAVAEMGTEAKLFDLVSQAGAHLREKLGVSGLSDAELGGLHASRPTNQEATRLYAEGLQKLRSYDAMAGRDLLEKAVAADPTYPLAHSALAAAWTALGYDPKAQEAAKRAFDLSAKSSREERLVIEGRYRETTKEWAKAVEIYRTLFSFFSDNLDYGLHLAGAQVAASKAADAFATVEELRKLSPPASDDARIDIAEGAAAEAISDFKREQAAALKAKAKATAQGARLLVAEALHYEGWSDWNLGDPKKALATYAQAQRLYAAAGHRSGVADIMNSTGNVLWDQGDLTGAQKIYEEALAIKREVGHRSGIAAMINNLANVLRDQGELAAAKQSYEEAIAIRRELGDKSNLAGTLTNLANVLKSQGDLPSAKRVYEEATALAREIGRKYILALSLHNLAEVFYYQGELELARKMEEESLAIAREIGRKTSWAAALFGLGEVLAAEGNLAEARKKYEESLAMQTELAKKGDVMQGRLALAALAIEEKRPAEMAAVSKEAVEYFRTQKETHREAYAQALLGQALLGQTRPAEVQKAIDRARTLAEKSQYRHCRFAVAITAARVNAVLGRSAAAIKSLETIIQETAQAGFVNYQLEARLALGEIKLKSGQSASGLAQLTALAAEAKAKGFGLIARKAATL